MRVSSEEESTDLPSFAERSKRQNTSKPFGRHKGFFNISPKIGILKLVSSRRLPELGAGTARMHEETVFIYRKFGVMLCRRTIKFSVRRTNLACSIVTQSCGAATLFSLDAKLPNEKRNCARYVEKCKSSCRQNTKTGKEHR